MTTAKSTAGDGSTDGNSSAGDDKTLSEMSTKEIAELEPDTETLMEKYAITEDDAKLWAERINDAKTWQGRIDKEKEELNKTQQELKKAKGEGKDKPEEGEESKFVTKEELWEQQHADDIALYGDEEYQEDIEAGVPRDKALKYAKMRFESDPDRAERARAEAMAGSGRKANREGGEPITVTEHDTRFKITPERKAELEKKYPHLKGAAPSPELPT